MEQEATASRWVNELKHQLESSHCESQDRAVEATKARAVKLLAEEQATTAERGLDVVKACQAETEAAL